MRIACLAWGSLIWKPGVLPASEWKTGGPTLPIEFARVGDRGELATVITPGHPLSEVRWSELQVSDLAAARRLLGEREGVERGDDIGAVVVGQPFALIACATKIHQWASVMGEVEAVVWTAFAPRFEQTEGRVPSPQEAARYLRSLGGSERRHAEDYVRRVPNEIQTPNRRALEEAMSS